MLPALVVPGYLSIQGSIKPVCPLAEPLQTVTGNGGRKALIPVENKQHFPAVSGDIVERVDPIFYSTLIAAALKAPGLT